MNFQSKLKGMRDQAKAAQESYRPGGFLPVPDNDYLVKIKATLDETQKLPVRMQVTWCFVIAEGEQEGRQIWDRTIIENNPTGLNICHGRVDALGYEWASDEEIDKNGLSFLEPIVNDITERCPTATVRIRSKENDEGYMNTRVYIREVHDLPGENPTPVSDEAPVDPSENNAEPAQDNQALLDFCASQGLDGVTSDMNNEQIISGLREGGIDFHAPELKAEEIELLKANGAEDLIRKEVKKPSAPIIRKPASSPAPKAKPKGKK